MSIYFKNSLGELFEFPQLTDKKLNSAKSEVQKHWGANIAVVDRNEFDRLSGISLPINVQKTGDPEKGDGRFIYRIK